MLVKGDENSSITLRLITRQFVDLRQNEKTGLDILSTVLVNYFESINNQVETKVDPLQIEPINVKEPTEPERPSRQFGKSRPLGSRTIVYTLTGILLFIIISGAGYYMINKALKEPIVPTTSTTPDELQSVATLPDEGTSQSSDMNEGEVDIISWAGYIERGDTDPAYDWVTEFENQTQCKVINKIAATSDEMKALLTEGSFDLVTASSDVSLNLIYDGLVQAIDISRIPSWGKIDPRLQNSPWHTLYGTHYGVPFQWNANVLIYNTNVFPEAPTSWNVVFEEMILPDRLSNKGRIQAYGQPIYIADVALYLKAHNPELRITDPYQLTQKQFDAAINLLRTQRSLLNRYWSDAFIQMDDFMNEGVVAAPAWLFQEHTLEAQGQPVSFIIPHEGATAVADTFMMQKNPPHPNCAYLWLEHPLDPKVQGDVAAWYGSNPAVPEGCLASELLGSLTGCK